MIESRGCTRFAEDSIRRIGLAGGRQKFEGHLPVQHQVVGQAHFAHASTAEHFNDSIMPLRHGRPPM
jgi:hypothetical protein